MKIERSMKDKEWEMRLGSKMIVWEAVARARVFTKTTVLQVTNSVVEARIRVGNGETKETTAIRLSIVEGKVN